MPLRCHIALVTEDRRPENEAAPDSDAIERAHAVYTPLMLSVYDVIVHGISNRFAWRCSTERLIEFYRANLSPDHLEAGVGTGYFIDGSASQFRRLVLIDLNRNCLVRAEQRLARFNPSVHQVNLLAPIKLDLAPFASVGLTYVLHCLPGELSDKLAAIDNLRPLMQDKALLFGATILGRGTAQNFAARRLLNLYNAKGIFNNGEDDLASLLDGLRRRFDQVDVEVQGCVALFRAA